MFNNCSVRSSNYMVLSNSKISIYAIDYRYNNELWTNGVLAAYEFYGGRYLRSGRIEDGASA